MKKMAVIIRDNKGVVLDGEFYPGEVFCHLPEIDENILPLLKHLYNTNSHFELILSLDNGSAIFVKLKTTKK